ncbi:MAG: hypothetical protein IPI07_02570 [Flavobacteriales bacterium]|nr:hypothetical protein [Flavobacteriales bacterium]
MRHIALWIALAVSAFCPVRGQGLLVNEVCPICPLPSGARGWLELFNSGPNPVQLAGTVFQVGPYRAQLDTQRLLAPGMLHLISLNPTFDGRSQSRSPYPHRGEAFCSSPQEARGCSMLSPGLRCRPGSRSADGRTAGADWSFSQHLDPANRRVPLYHAYTHWAPAPTIQLRPGALEIEACEGCEVRYTTDGSPPEGSQAQAYHAPIDIWDRGLAYVGIAW